MNEGRSALKIVSGNCTGYRYLGKPRFKWEDNIKMDLKEMCQYMKLDSFVSEKA